MSKKDWVKQGRKDRTKDTKQNSFVDHLTKQVFGGPYRPPKDSSNRRNYKRGWDKK